MYKRQLQTMADMCNRFVGDREICGRLNADQFVCLLERRLEYRDSKFAGICEEVSRLSRMKNVMIKWGVYPITDKSLSVEEMCDRAVPVSYTHLDVYKRQSSGGRVTGYGRPGCADG